MKSIHRPGSLAAVVTSAAVLSTSVVATWDGGAASAASRRDCAPASDCAYAINRSGIVAVQLSKKIAYPAVKLQTTHPMNTQIQIAVTPAGKVGYLSIDGVTEVNLKTGKLGRNLVPHGFLAGYGLQTMALGDSGKMLYLGMRDTTTDTYSIISVTLPHGGARGSVRVPGGINGLAVSSDGTTAYVGENSVLQIVNLSTDTLGPQITVPDGVSSIVVAANGETAYATASGARRIGDVTYNYITPIDLATAKAESPIKLRHAAHGLALGVGTQLAYATGGVGSGNPKPPAVSIINLASEKVVGSITVPGNLNAIAIPPSAS